LTTTILSGLFIFLGAFTQSLTGFGMALVAMAMLPSLITLPVATPLVAAVSLALEILMVIRYRQAFRLNVIWRALIGSAVGAPLGVILLSRVDEQGALFVLGLVIAGYAGYGLIGLVVPELSHPAWAWLAGLLSGMLGGAYNTSGPPIVIYGNCRRWSPQEFKSNLSGFFVINSLIVVTSHGLTGHFNKEVIPHLAWAIPAMGFGFLAGQIMDRWLNPDLFRQLVLILLLILGLRLMV
jgi:uncharacterized membrane protein YfcA